MVFEKLINDNLSEKTDVKLQLKDFLDAKVVEDVKKKELEPLSKAVTDNVDFDERLESDMNVTHVTKLLEAMRDNLKPTADTPEARKQAYMNAYTKRGKAYTMGVQSGLKLMGFDLGSHEIDGERGENTEKAIAQFQEWQGIDVDKRAGFDTISKMLEVGITTKAPAEVITKVPVLKKKAPTVEKNPDFYTTHTEFTEKEFGKVKNKVYKVEKFEDIPTTIAKDTVIDFGSYYIFSNGKVYDYGTDGKTLVRKGDRSELDDSGKWKEVTPKTPAEVVVTKEQIVTPEKSKARTQEVNEDIYKVCDTTLRDVLNPFNKETKAGIESRLNPIQKAWYNIHIMGKETNSMTSFVIEQKNPSFTVSIWDRAVNSSRITLGTIPFESYYKDNKFFKEGVYDRIVNLVQGRIDSENQALAKILKEKKNQETKQNIEKILNEFRGSTFTLNELFPDKVGDMTYEGYFNKFDDKKLEIRGSKYTKVIAENLNDITKTKVQFDLNDDGDDEKYNINKTVMLGDILANGKYNRAKAIEVLKPIVKDIVEKNFTV